MKRLLAAILLLTLMLTGCSQKEKTEYVSNHVFSISYDSEIWEDIGTSDQSPSFSPTETALKKGADSHANVYIWLTNFQISGDELFDLMKTSGEKNRDGEVIISDTIPASLMTLGADTLVFATQESTGDDGTPVTYTYFSAAFYGSASGNVVVANYTATTDEGRKACDDLLLRLNVK